MKLDYDNINFADPLVWGLFSRGETVGVFQCESRLVRHWLKQIRPRNLWELSAVIALVRPGPLDSGFAEQYVRYKHKEVEFTSFGHPIIDEIFDITEHVLCIHEDTLVAMGDGSHKPIKLIQKNDRVLSIDETTLKCIPETCDGCLPTKKSIGKKLSLSNGYSVVLTPDHKVLTHRGMVEIQHLDEMDVVACGHNTNTNPIDAPIASWLGSNEDVSYLLGLITADAQIKTGINLCCGSLKENAIAIASWIGQKLPLLSTTISWHTRCWYLHISCPLLANKPAPLNRTTLLGELLDRLDMRHTCYDKRIPPQILQSTLSVQKAFLAGWIDGDGMIAEGMVNLTTVSPGLRADGARLLQNLGLDHSLTTPHKIYIAKTDRFFEQVQPYLVLKSITGLRSIARTGHYPRSYLSHCRGRSPFVTSKTAQKHGIILGDIRYHKISSITDVGECQFYDISVRHTHNLLGNGIVLSNCYQEQLMSLGARLAWPHLPENEKLLKVDALRKSVGKKDQKKVLEIGKEFVEGCLLNGVEPALAEKLFEIIKGCGRYLFNLAHSMSYAYVAYFTAYDKVYHPKEFFATYLTYAKFKPMKKWEHLAELIQDARRSKITILPPNVNAKNPHFCIEGDSIRYGLSHVKFVGNTAVELLQTIPMITDWRRLMVVIFTKEYGIKLKKNIAESLISVGAFADTGVSRKTLLAIQHLLLELSPKERAWVLEHLPDIETPDELLNLVRTCADGVAVKTRKSVVRDLIALTDLNTKDSPEWIWTTEHYLTGTALTVRPIETVVDAVPCLDCLGSSVEGTSKKIAGVLMKIEHSKTRKNDPMAKIDISDGTAILTGLPIFSDVLNQCQDSLAAKARVIMHLKMGKKGWIVESLYPV